MKSIKDKISQETFDNKFSRSLKSHREINHIFGAENELFFLKNELSFEFYRLFQTCFCGNKGILIKRLTFKNPYIP
jgi:hypothetical protein